MAMVQETIKLKALGYIVSVVIELKVTFIFKNTVNQVINKNAFGLCSPMEGQK